MRKWTPQRKKQFSYEHDCRNRHGQNAKASRKIIPLRKRKRLRALRRGLNQSLHHGNGKAFDADAIEIECRSVRMNGWRKLSDTKLRDAIIEKKNARTILINRKKHRDQAATV